jgi:hypothetical protein
MPRISQSETIVLGALDDLKRDWQIARLDWRDQAREQFEADYLRELEGSAVAAVRSMTELTLLMRRVVRECT